MNIRSTTVHEDGSTTVRTVPGSIILDMETGNFLNPHPATRPNVRVQYFPAWKENT